MDQIYHTIRPRVERLRERRKVFNSFSKSEMASVAGGSFKGQSGLFAYIISHRLFANPNRYSETCQVTHLFMLHNK